MQGSTGRDYLRFAAALLLGSSLALAARPSAAFVTFESGQVRPLALSPDGSRLFAVNTPDDQLEIFDNGAGTLTHAGSVPVGLEPVAVAARTNTEVWVVNHLSDSVSIVDLSLTPPRVVRTLLIGDEPRDIVFAGPTDIDGHFIRAFITTARRGQNVPNTAPPLFTTEGTPRALVWVFDATDLGTTLEGVPKKIIELFGDTPRALAATSDGSTVYAAVFHSGNQTTAISEGAVCNGGSMAGACALDGIMVTGGMAGAQVPGGLPAPNANVENTPGPEVGLVLKFNNANSHWEDQLSRNWTNAVRFRLPDLDVFQINANAMPQPVETNSFAHVGTVLFNMLVNPANNKLYVTNTDAHNEVRFEGPGTPPSTSTVRGHLHEARITVIDGTNVLPRHLNKHITALMNGYRTVPMPATIKDDSLATPMGMAISGTTLYVAAFGSSAIGRFDTTQLENNTFTPSASTHIDVSGGGPTGLVADTANDRLYVLTRFDNSLKVIDTTSNTEIAQHSLHNPEPAVVVDGRPFLYDAHFTSSNGEASCSSCHIFADFDSLGWDLGNPDDIVRNNPNPVGPIGSMQDFHPMKGPMTTQTLRGMAHSGPMHWRGDRTGGYVGQPLNEQLAFEAFNVAFAGLLGRDEGQISDPDMTAFAQFILQIQLPPNPVRDLDNSLNGPQNSGQQASGQDVFLNFSGTDGIAKCQECHNLDASQGFFGTGGLTTFENETQEFKVAHLSNAYQKVGMFGMPDVPFINVPNADRQVQGDQVRGFGFLHDGSVATIFDFLHASVFFINDTNRADLEQYILAFDTTFAPIVGQQLTLTNTNGAAVDARLDLMINRAMTSFVLVGQPTAKECDLVVKGPVLNPITSQLEARGFVMDGATGLFHSDRSTDMLRNDSQMRALASGPGLSLTYTCVPPGEGTRVGIDRDQDGYLDRDEIDAGSDPADPLSTPGGPIPTPTATPPPGGATAVGAQKLLIKNKVPDDESKNKIIVLAKSGSIVIPLPLSADDPRCNGDPVGTVKATITVSSATSGQTVSAGLPCENWSAIGSAISPRGYKYRDPELNDGPVKLLSWKDGKLLKATLSGQGTSVLGYDLQVGTSENPVDVQFASGASGLCMQCSGASGKDGSDGKLFKANDCPAPPSCP